MDDLFYKNQEQVERIVKDFGNEILPKKSADKNFFSNHRIFKYADELDRVHFDYGPQSPKEFIKEFAGFFENALNPDSTGNMYNVHPNVNLYAQTASFITSLAANPNFAQDMSSGKLMLIEKTVIKYLSELAGWDTQKSGGVFTFGGKGTCLYALKIALDKMYPKLREEGLKGKNIVISNDVGHPCHVEICNWLGLGTDSCVRLKTVNGTVPVDDFRAEFERIVKRGDKLPLIIVNGMGTNTHTIDDIKGIAEARDSIVAKYKLDYTPHLHVDSVLGWVYLLLTRYDFEANPLSITGGILDILREKRDLIANMSYADSFGADFHKTGFAGYASSVFVTKDKSILHNIERHYKEDENLEFTQYSPYSYSLELSRSAHGPVSAYAVLKTLGVEGFVKVLANHLEGFEYIKELFHSQKHTEVLNYGEHSGLMFFIFKPHEDIVIKENMDPELVSKIKEFNLGFYRFLIGKHAKGEGQLFFTCSRSHTYLGQSFGSFKVYPYNSHFDLAEAKKTAGAINDLYKEYLINPEGVASVNVFDFLQVKGEG